MKRIAQASLAFLMLTAIPSIVGAQAKPVVATTNVKKVPDLNYSFPIKNKTKISANSYAELTDINLDTSDENNVLTYVVKMTNGDKTPIQLIDYWMVVKSKSTGTTYSAALATEDKTKSKVLPKSSQELKFFSNIDKSVNLDDLSIQIVKWDMMAASSNYTRKLGEVSIPKNFTYLISPSQYKTINVMNVPVKVNVKDYTMSIFGDSNLVSVSVQYENVGKVALQAAKIKYYIRTEDGLKYELNAGSGSDFTIQPKEKKTVVLGANIPSAAKSKNWILQVDQQDDTAKINLGLASFSLPASSNNVVPASQEKIISVANKQVGVEVRYGSIVGSADRNINLSVSYINRDTGTVTLPKYSYELHAAGGFSFPLTTKDTTITLNPLQRKSVSLTAVLPETIPMDDLQLVLNQQIGGGSGGTGGTQPSDPPASDTVNVPVAVFNLQNLSTAISNKPIFVDTQTGQYMVTLEEIQRLPWSDSDIISAHFKIENPSIMNSAPVPIFQGNMVIDGIVLPDTQYVQTDNVMSIAANSSIDAYVISKIPYGGNYSNVQVKLQEKVGEDVKEVAMFADSNKPADFTPVAVNTDYLINTKGKTTKISTRKTNLYSDSNKTILYTELVVENEENRQSSLSKIVGYFTSGFGDYYKATFNQSELPTQAGGTLLVTASAQIPSSIALSNLKLLIGQGVTDNKLSALKDEPTALVGGVLLELPGSNADINGSIKNLDFFPYTFSITNFRASLASSNSVNVAFDYNLAQDMNYDIQKYEHKVVLEMEDAVTHKVFEKEIDLATDLTKGTHTFNYTINDSVLENMFSGAYTLNVYDLFQGAKRLVGTQSFYY